MDKRIEVRKQRWINFLNTPGAGHIFIINYAPDNEAPPLPWRDLKDERIEWAWRQYERQLARVAWLRDDTVPYVHVRTGTEIFAEAFGCNVYFPDDNMPFALPLVHSAREAAQLKAPELSTSSLAYLFDMADELVKRAGNGALVQIVDIQSPMDIAALIWDKETFYPALIEAPEAVVELADKVKQLLTLFLDTWFARYGAEFIAHYPAYYMPVGITLSEDEVGAVSRRVFDRLFLPELTELSERYGGIGIHCCAHAKHQWEGFRHIPNLRLLNLNQPAGVLRESYPVFAGIPQMPIGDEEDAPWDRPARYPDGSRVVIQATAKTRDEALALADKLRAVCKRE